jgi:hypothetical protein
MSSTLDLNGGTTNLTAGTYTYYQITDTSGSHNGKLICAAGTVIRFDNKAGAGFSSVATAIEIYLNGTSSLNCAVISADPNPTNLWLMPASGTLIDAKYTDFVSYSGNTQANYWAFDSCKFAGMRYVTVEEFATFVGSTSPRLTLAVVVENASAEITERLKYAGISGGGGSTIKNVCMKLATADLITRYRMDGTKPESLTIGVISMKDGIDSAASTLRSDAYDLLTKYIEDNGQSKYRYYVRRTNK